MKNLLLCLLAASLTLFLGWKVRVGNAPKRINFSYDLDQFNRKMDTLQQVINTSGKTLTRDQAEQFMQAGYSVISGFYRDAKIDSTKTK